MGKTWKSASGMFDYVDNTGHFIAECTISSALDYLFETLKRYGHTFPAEFWDSVCKEVLFPIFAVLRSRSDVSRFSTHEDMSVWLSTTMIQALRDLVDLFAHYFDTLVRMLDPLLRLLVECICQGM